MLDTFGERLGKTLLRLGLSQGEAAALTGIPQSTLSDIIRKKKKVYKKSLLLAEKLNVSHDWLAHGMGGILNPKPHYIPVITDYFKFKLFLIEGFLDDNTRFLLTEENYGKTVFATTINQREFIICSTFESTQDISEILLWDESKKNIILNKESVKSEINRFLIHEKVQYDKIPKNIFSNECEKRLQPSSLAVSLMK